MAVIQRCSGLRWSRLYVALAELEKVGLVISYWRVRPLPKRKLYRLAESPRNPIE